ncbi:hypothetical protein P872_23880 [Rhodonellum psychrophilum GCM71 = DSM 17998]|uniref:Lipoprotein n=2 Tax=Rhodonellum TaxID=336827 RepID=U5C968_9BACT|nr:MULTISPECIES: hypothetical protein [Rhodonellum]ERM84752.1 hypothetical protein P872_23880 [Rhodonellum psychrophilum GCM71 = DSM 17998]SDZ12131.1 hypothetical protein SAMN05444412_10661 [Rhodonellum ikkaensis]
MKTRLLNKVWIFLLITMAAISCMEKVVYVENDYLIQKDSVNVTPLVSLSKYDRFNFMALYKEGVFFLFAKMIGDCYAVNSNGEVLWEINLSETSGDPSGIFQIRNATDFFGFHGDDLFFYQSDNTLKLFDLDGNLLSEHKIPISKDKSVVDVVSYSEHGLVIGTVDRALNDGRMSSVHTYNLKSKELERVFSKEMDFPLEIKIGAHAGKIYYVENLSTHLSILNLESKSIDSLPLNQSKNRSFQYHPPYNGDTEAFFSIPQAERVNYQNDGYKSLVVTGDDILFHHRVLKRNDKGLNFIELITLQRENGEMTEMLLPYTILNLDNHGNTLRLVKYDSEIYLKIAALDNSE